MQLSVRKLNLQIAHKYIIFIKSHMHFYFMRALKSNAMYEVIWLIYGVFCALYEILLGEQEQRSSLYCVYKIFIY